MPKTTTKKVMINGVEHTEYTETDTYIGTEAFRDAPKDLFFVALGMIVGVFLYQAFKAR